MSLPIDRNCFLNSYDSHEERKSCDYGNPMSEKRVDESKYRDCFLSPTFNILSPINYVSGEKAMLWNTKLCSWLCS